MLAAFFEKKNKLRDGVGQRHNDVADSDKQIDFSFDNNRFAPRLFLFAQFVYVSDH